MISGKSASLLYVVALCLCLCSCISNNQAPAVSFYYWRTDFALKSNEEKILKEQNVTKIYVRYFDIVYNEILKTAIPAAPIQFGATKYTGEIVPVLFVKNKVFEELDTVAIDTLATRTVLLLSRINRTINGAINEIQIDCDWTSKTANAYFHFLRLLRSKIQLNPSRFGVHPLPVLSATIRLHQVKYPKQQGVPPVDKGVLMFYNMGKISGSNDNSIYEQKTSRNYLSTLSAYPLPLNFALPVFAWGIHLRDGVVTELLNKMDSRDFQDKEAFSQIGKYRYKALASFFKKGFYFKKGDEVKVEQISADDLKGMATDLHHYYNKAVPEVIFYDLDSINISRYEKDVFQKTVAGF